MLGQAERQAVNTKIQGSAADLMKTALILLNRSLQEKLADVHLVHQIHDELLFQVRLNCLFTSRILNNVWCLLFA